MQATVWILDVTHRARRLDVPVPDGTRPLVAVQDHLREALELDLRLPVGLRALDRAPELLFVLPRAGEGDGWVPLREWAAADERGFSLYVESMLGGWQPPTRALDAFYFGNTPELAAKLAHLVLKGDKRGTTGWNAPDDPNPQTIPEVGVVSIVTDGFGYPVCAIRSEKVEHLRFGDVNASHAWVEGEGDRTLEDWREGHLRYFHHEAAALGAEFSEDCIVYFEHFRVIGVFGKVDR
jgi:uncharacterized protein YhfF